MRIWKQVWMIASVLLGLIPLSLHAANAKPDWRVTELTAERTPSDQVPLRVKVKTKVYNGGTVTSSGQFVTRLEYRRKSTDSWSSLFDWHGGATAAKGGALYEKSLDFQEGGSYTFRIVVDPDNAIAETSETNNTKTITKTFEAGTPDLAVTGLTAAVTKTLPNGSVKVKVEWDVENIGNGKAKPAFVIVLKAAKNSSSFAEVQRSTKSVLEPGQSQHYSKEITYADLRSVQYRVSVDDTFKVHELTESNNVGTSAVVKP